MEEDIETCGWFVFYKDQLLIEKKNGMYTIPFGTEPPMPVPVGSTIHTIGEIEGHTAKTFSVHAPVPGCDVREFGLIRDATQNGAPVFALIGAVCTLFDARH